MGPRKLKKASSGKGSFSFPTGPPPPGGPIEIVLSFDTTGSMGSCIGEVRSQVQHLIERLFADIPGLRVAVFAHGDYCDSRNYVTKWVDFSNDKKNLCDFVNNVQTTGGGDWEECYELVLRQVRTELSWTPGTQRSLVMIGDAIPHPKTDPQNKLKIDWKVETQSLRDEGIKIYSVQCMYNDRAAPFWRKMAEIGGGRHLKLDEFRTVIDIIMSICYRETGAEYFTAYEKEVRTREGDKMRSELNLMFDALRDAGISPATVSTPAGTPAVSLGGPSTCKDSTKTSTRASRKRKGGDMDTEDATLVAVKKTRRGKVTKKPSLTTKPSLAKKHNTGAKYVADKLVAKAKKNKSVVAKGQRCCRESIFTTKFMPDLVWSKWYTAFQTDEPTTGASVWCPRFDSGYRHKRLFYHDTKLPAVYELAVQPTDGCKKYPVWSSVTRGFNSLSWDRYMTRRNHLQGQLDAVLDNGAKVFVRRGKIDMDSRSRINVPVTHTKTGEEKIASTVGELRQLMTEVYDYAWAVKGGNHRELNKNGVKISDSKF